MTKDQENYAIAIVQDMYDHFMNNPENKGPNFSWANLSNLFKIMVKSAFKNITDKETDKLVIFIQEKIQERIKTYNLL